MRIHAGLNWHKQTGNDTVVFLFHSYCRHIQESIYVYMYIEINIYVFIIGMRVFWTRKSSTSLIVPSLLSIVFFTSYTNKTLDLRMSISFFSFSELSPRLIWLFLPKHKIIMSHSPFDRIRTFHNVVHVCHLKKKNCEFP